jgi:hypothetical protein
LQRSRIGRDWNGKEGKEGREGHEEEGVKLGMLLLLEGRAAPFLFLKFLCFSVILL